MDTLKPMRSTDNTAPTYFATPPLKFIAMSLCTLGIYQVFWSYKNWKFVKNRDGSEIMPFWRAFFYPVWHYSLLSALNETLNSEKLANKRYRVSVSVLLVLLTSTLRLPDPYWLMSILTFVAFVPLLKAMQSAAQSGPIQAGVSSFHPSNLIAYALGGPLVVFTVLSVIGYFPSPAVVTGDSLWAKDVAFLRTESILSPEEDIAYFYSMGAVSIRSDGQFISDEGVTSYFEDPASGQMYINYSPYEEIADVDVYWAEGFLDSTIVTVTTSDDYQFEVWLSPEADGDHRFVEELQRRWNRVRQID